MQWKINELICIWNWSKNSGFDLTFIFTSLNKFQFVNNVTIGHPQTIRLLNPIWIKKMKQRVLKQFTSNNMELFHSPDRSWPPSRRNIFLKGKMVQLWWLGLNIPGLYSFLGVSWVFCPRFPRISPVRGFTGKVVPRWVLDNIG